MQALVSLGFGSFGSIGQVVLVGLTPNPPISDPIDWIGFTASGSVPACSASGDVSTLAAIGSRSLANCTGSAALASASADIPTATITGRPYA